MDKRIIAALAVVLIAGVGFVLLNQPGPPQVATLQGKVTDASGAPLAGVTVSAGGKTAQTSADGAWLFTVDKGTYEVKAAKTGYNPASSTVSASEAKTYTVDLKLALIPIAAKQATITGKVTGPSGSALMASVTVSGLPVTVSVDGSWSTKVNLGTYTVLVTKEGYVSSTQTVSATEEKTYNVDINLAVVPPVKPKEVTLKVLTRHGSDITYQSKIAFLASETAKKYNIVDIKFVGISGNLWIDTIKRSGDIDLAWGGGPVLFDQLAGADLLAPLNSPVATSVLSQLPAEIGGMPLKRVKDGKVVWAGAAISSFGFTLNKQYLANEKLPEPSKWMDLANETYAVTLPNPSVATADAMLSTSNTRIFEIVIQRYGWAEGWRLLTRMGANSRIFDKSELVRDAAIQGSVGIGTTIDFYGYTAQMEAPDICKYVLPEDGTLINPDPIALVKTSPNLEAAEAFTLWCLSPEGQKVWLIDTINRMPANPAVFDTPEGIRRADLKALYELTKTSITIVFSDDLALSYETSLMNYHNAAVVRPQLKLTDVWMKLTSAYNTGKITKAQYNLFIAQLGNPETLEFTDPATGTKQVFTEAFAKSVNERLGSDPTYRTKLVDALMKAAEIRYDGIAADLKKVTG